MVADQASKLAVSNATAAKKNLAKLVGKGKDLKKKALETAKRLAKRDKVREHPCEKLPDVLGIALASTTVLVSLFVAKPR